MPQFTLVDRACPICGPASHNSLFADANFDLNKLDAFAFASRKLPEYMHWRLLHCSTCDLVYSSPAPPVEQLGELYKDAAFGSSNEAQLASKTYGRVLRANVLPNLPDRAGALDIGTGDGAFLHELLDAGFSAVIGIEPSSAPIELAHERVRASILQRLFQPDVFAAEQFRVVTCFQTIEHVPEPLALCREAHRILKPGGALILIGHNRRALSAKIMGRKSPIFDIEHLQLFSPISARRLLVQAGFEKVGVFPLTNVYPLSYWAQLFPLGRKLKQVTLSALRGTGIGNVRIPLRAGNLVAVAYR